MKEPVKWKENQLYSGRRAKKKNQEGSDNQAYLILTHGSGKRGLSTDLGFSDTRF